MQVPPRAVVVVLVALAVAAGVALRVNGLATLPIGGDEIYTIQGGELALRPSGSLDAEELEALQWYQSTTPLLYVANLWPFTWLDATPLAARVAPFVIGLLSLLLLPLAMGSLYGRRAGWIATVLLALDPQHIEFCRYGRYQTFTYLLGGLTMCVTVSALRRGTLRAGAWILVAGAACTLAHLTGTLVFGAALLAWISLRFRPRDLLLLAGVCLLVAVMASLGGWLDIAEVIRARFAFRDWRVPHWLIVGSIGYNNGLLLSAFAVFAAAWCLLRSDRASRALIVCVALPLAVLLALSTVVIVGSRFGSSAEFGIVALAVLPLAAWTAPGARPAVRNAGVAAIALLCLSQIPLLVSNQIDGQRFDYPAICDVLRREASPEDVIVSKWHMILERLLERSVVEAPGEVQGYEALVDAAPRDVYVVVQRQRGRRSPPFDRWAISSWLDARADRIASFGRRRWDDAVYRFELELYRARLPSRSPRKR